MRLKCPLHSSIVELQHVKELIDSHPTACDHFADNPQDLRKFYLNVNKSPNLIYLPDDLNNAKGIALDEGRNFGPDTSGKAVVSS